MEHLDSMSDRLASIEAATSIFDKYIWTTAERRAARSGQDSANSYADLLGKSDPKKIIDEALSLRDLAGSYGAAAKVLSGGDTRSGSQVPGAKRKHVIPRRRK